MIPGRDLKDPYGRLFQNADLPQFKSLFEARVKALSNDRPAAVQELFDTKWGPTKIPLYNVLLSFTVMVPSHRPKYFALLKWLAQDAKVPVDGTDLSGTPALMHSISTKPYLDLEFAQLMVDGGADINHRNRFGSNAAHDLVKVYSFDAGTLEKSGNALK